MTRIGRGDLLLLGLAFVVSAATAGPELLSGTPFGVGYWLGQFAVLLGLLVVLRALVLWTRAWILGRLASRS